MVFFLLCVFQTAVSFPGSGGVIFPEGFQPQTPDNIDHLRLPRALGGGNCSVDFRHSFPNPPCNQKTQAWCWATCISMFSYYYNTTSLSTNCSTVECTVVGKDLNTSCCPVHSQPSCDRHGAQPQEITETAARITGRPMTLATTVPSEKELQELLMAGKTIN
mmetsp:Transcript_1359/g.2583  ORF Transcript_1359/g.2583 Transcript_1359/m.2583 type:complete len:162 (+) Transcript_1359:34-519(+)